MTMELFNASPATTLAPLAQLRFPAQHAIQVPIVQRILVLTSAIVILPTTTMAKTRYVSLVHQLAPPALTQLDAPPAIL